MFWHSRSIYLLLFSLHLFPYPPPVTSLSQLSLSPLTHFFCPSKHCLFYPASHHYSAKWPLFHHIIESLSSLWMQTLFPISFFYSFCESLCAKFCFLIPSSSTLPLASPFLWFVHIYIHWAVWEQLHSVWTENIVTTSRLEYSHVYGRAITHTGNTKQMVRLCWWWCVCACSRRSLQGFSHGSQRRGSL